MPSLVWQMPLFEPPQIVSMGRHAHGFVPNDRYRLDDLWSLHLYCYDAILRLDGQEISIRPGTLGLTPPGTLMETRYFGVSVHLYAHFRLPPGPTRPVAAVTDLGPHYEMLYRELYEASVRFTEEPASAAACVWNAIWKGISSAQPPVPESAETHRAVRRVRDLIERNLSRPISVAELAHQAEIAQSYLSQLFKEAYGETVAAHIRRRRMERACCLLLRSTLPIKVVASAVGFADLQQFNKAIRAHFGVSPRGLRARGQTTPELSYGRLI